MHETSINSNGARKEEVPLPTFSSRYSVARYPSGVATQAFAVVGLGYVNKTVLAAIGIYGMTGQAGPGRGALGHDSERLAII